MMILRCVPQFVDEIWGDEDFGKFYGVGGKLGEVWLCSGHPERMTRVFDQNDLEGNWNEIKERWEVERFPFLIKHIKTREWLSVQVHPDDAYAEKNGEPWGKPEMWYFIKGGRLVNGLVSGALERLKNGDRDWNSLLSFIDVKAGQAMYIEPGTVHAIGPKIELYEFQMTSDITYRFYDWGRGRETHFDQAMEVVKETVAKPFDLSEFNCSHFKVKRLNGLPSFLDRRSVYLASRSSFNGKYFEKPTAYISTDGGKLACEGEIFEMQMP
jgi:mannose-6-phosphate isomerase|uniref:Class I mannose-6-phosphate isomerase n=1 Tax=Mesoaciditoga lauensis TaxID=1495039 RepID=A0A7V3REH5_9BACT